MKKLLISLILLCAFQSSMSQVVINELDCDTPGTDTQEFVELKSDIPNFLLDGFVLVFFNGSTSGMNSSYFAIDLDGFTTDENGLLVIGSETVAPFPQLLISENVIQNGADAVAIYQGDDTDFPEMTLATITNLVDVLIYDTSDPDDLDLIDIFNDDPNFADIQQINEGSSNNTNSIQRNNDGTYFTATPTPRVLNDGSGVLFNPISISTSLNAYGEGESFEITFTSEGIVTEDVSFQIVLDNGTFDSSDFSGVTSLTIPNGQDSVSTTITLIDDTLDEGDEELLITFNNLQSPYIPFNNQILIRVVDNDFTSAVWGTPLNPTFGLVQSTQPNDYYDSLDGLADDDLKQAMQDIIADPNTVRAQTYNDVIDILKQADQNPENSNQVWLVYIEQGRSKLDFQTTSNNNGKWNREHTYPRSRGGFFSIEDDDIIDGPDIFWTTEADSLRHANSDAHALRAADGPENSTRGNDHYSNGNTSDEYNGPSGTAGSFYGDVARSVLFMEVRYNGLQVVNGLPNTTGQLGDLATLLDWHRNDPPDDYEMNRNNIVYTWQFNRNPFIDYPELVEHIWGNKIGQIWNQPLSLEESDLAKVNVYPNPASNRLFFNGITEETNLTIYSVLGKEVLSATISNDIYLDLNLLEGMYLLKLSSKGKTLTKKIVIQ